MKKFFYFMSLMLCMALGSVTFTACGDDDDNSSKGGGTGGPDTSITAQELVGCWYGVDENSSEKINVFVMNFASTTAGSYMEYKAKARNNWNPEVDNVMAFTWTLANGVMTATLTDGEGHTAVRQGEILQKVNATTLKVKRYLNEAGTQTDVIEMHKISNPQEAYAVLNRLVAEKTGNNNNNNNNNGNFTAQDLIGKWYGVQKNTSEAVDIFVMTFKDGGEGEYLQMYAGVDSRWQVQTMGPLTMAWMLQDNMMMAKIVLPDGNQGMLAGEVLEKISDGKLKVKRYLNETGTETDVVELVKVNSDSDVADYLNRLVAGKK